jgi:hypothetical protein
MPALIRNVPIARSELPLRYCDESDSGMFVSGDANRWKLRYRFESRSLKFFGGFGPVLFQ